MSKNNIEPPIIVIFGITGDLSKKKLMPALYHMLSENMLPEDTKIIGTSRKPLEKQTLLSDIELCILDKDNACDKEGLAKLSNSLQTFQLNPDNLDDFQTLKQLITKYDNSNSKIHMFYMSIPSSAYEPIVSNLAKSDFNGSNTRLLLEKPFGYDIESAKRLIEEVDKAYSENQIYRIDHYLAKETAQNLLTFRLHNPIFSTLWNSHHIKSINIRALETIGIEGRANFYEQTGALRDFIQSHLMQLLSIVMMDLPSDMTSEAIHSTKINFFNQLKPADPKLAIRGQYDSYREEVKNEKSNVETYAKLVLEHESELWRGTKIILETGKAMSEKTTDITVEFITSKESNHNNLIFQLQPNEGISLDLIVKEPGLENNMHHTALEFRYDHIFKNYQYIDAYERVLLDAIHGDQSLFASDKEVIATWQVLQPILDYWLSNSDQLNFYTVGSQGVDVK
ncbi:MAG TPA: glucose-6-phosphate dehydrogenase [Patescibacteria group bacterium]|nr:glucose-6-phosphate dehydrogenase [Patescibacteria group bacterium]